MNRSHGTRFESGPTPKTHQAFDLVGLFFMEPNHSNRNKRFSNEMIVTYYF